MDFELLIVILVDGLVYSSYLFLVAVGLTVIFGVQKVLNVTHGSFYAFGAYLAAYLIGLWSRGGLPDAGGFLLILVSALILGLILGIIIERGLLKFLYDRDEHIVVLADGGPAIKVRSLRRMRKSERWGPDKIAEIVATAVCETVITSSP